MCNTIELFRGNAEKKASIKACVVRWETANCGVALLPRLL